MKPPVPPPSAERGAGRAVLCGAAGGVLLFSTSLAQGYGLPKLLALAAGTAAAWAALSLRAARGLPLRRPMPLERPLAAGLVAMAAAWAASPDRFLSLTGVYSFYSDGLLAYVLCAALCLAAAWSDLPERPGAALEALAAAGGLVGAYAVLQRLGLDPWGGFRVLPEGRAYSTLGGPVPLGAVLAMAAPAAAHWASDAAAPRRALGAVLLLAVAGGLWAAGSRGAFLAAFGGLLLWKALARGAAPGGGRLLAVLAAGAALALVALAGRRTERSDSARLALWRCVPAIVREAPFVGVGPSRFQAAMRRGRGEELVRDLGPRATQADAHNDLLQAAATTGLLGLAAFLWLAGAAGLQTAAALREPGRREAAGAAAGALAALFVQAKVNPVPLGCWAWAAVLAGTLAGGERRPVRAALPTAAAVAAAAALLFAGVLTAADAAFLRARRAAAAGRRGAAEALFAAAEAKNPYELFYRVTHAAFLESASREAPPEEKARLLGEAVSQGEAAARLRPAEPDGWAMLGTYLLVSRLAGGPDRLAEAEAALARAHALDPFAPAVLENRLQLAVLRGDEAARREREADLRRLDALRPGAR